MKEKHSGRPGKGSAILSDKKKRLRIAMLSQKHAFSNEGGVQVVVRETSTRMAALTSSLFAALFAAFGWYDVVHFHAEGSCAMMWIPKLFGKRCIATIHGA